MAYTARPRLAYGAQQQQQPQTPQFGGQPMPNVGSPQAQNWMQPRQQSMGAQPMPQPAMAFNPAQSALSAGHFDTTRVQPQGVMHYGPNVVPQYGNSYQPPSPNQSVFLPRGPMMSSQAMRTAQGYSTDQYGRQFLATPRLLGTELPAAGQGAWMQGRSLSGAPAGVFVQSPLPRPEGGMDRATDRTRPSAFMGPESAARSAMEANRPQYAALANRQQADRDNRIISRARARGLSANVPAVRLAMQRLGMLTPGQGTPGGQPAVVPGAAAPVPGQVSARNVQRWSGDPFVVGALGTDYASSSPENFRRAFGMAKTPADHQKIAEAWRDRIAMEPELGKKVAENPALKEEFDAFTGGVDSWSAYSKIAEERRRKQSRDPAQPLPPPRPPVIPPLFNDRGPRSAPYYIPPTSPGSR